MFMMLVFAVEAVVDEGGADAFIVDAGADRYDAGDAVVY